VEKFGSMINTSFFETANLLGTIKIKGYINIESSVGGISRVALTDAGSSLMQVAEQKSHDPLEPLDNAILHALAAGAKELDSIQRTLNIRGADLAYHINKLVTQGFMDYEVRSAKVYFVLTEQGFNSTGSVRVQQKLDSQKPASTTLADFVGEEGEGEEEESEVIDPGERPIVRPAPAAQPSDSSSAPPWVNPSDVKGQEHKEDVAHLLREEQQEHKSAHHKHEKPKKPRRELTPDEVKRAEAWKRRFSKLEYYAQEYAPYFLLLLVVLGIFVGAIYLSLSRIS
jgi:hypothetical protein